VLASAYPKTPLTGPAIALKYSKSSRRRLPGKHLHHVLSLIFAFTIASHELLRQVVQQRGTASLAAGALAVEVRLGDLVGFDEA